MVSPFVGFPYKLRQVRKASSTMGIISLVYKCYHKLIHLGITDQLSFPEKLRIKTCNLFSLLAVPGMIIHFFYNLFGPNVGIDYVVTGLFLIIVNITFLLNYFGQHLFAKMHAILSTLLLIGILHATYGWEIRAEPVYLMFLLTSLYFFRKKKAILMGTGIVAVYLLVAWKLLYIPPIIEQPVAATIPFILFAFSLITLVILTVQVLNENFRFNRIAKHRNQELKAKNEELERFAYIASHDLKSPLRNIISFSGLIEKALHKESFDSVPEYLTYIQTNAHQMAILIEDILEFSKINTVRQDNKKWVDLNQLSHNIETLLSQEIEQKQAVIHCESLPHYFCNEARFSLLFQNLIQNGIKYNENPHPTINISASSKDDFLYLHFQDNGIGIEEQYHNKIFEYFKRLHAIGIYEGTGIGLGLCKKIVQTYQGSISVQSCLTKGSIFTVKLPLTEAKFPPQKQMPPFSLPSLPPAI